MKKIYLLAILAIFSFHLSAQTVWEKHPDNPLMTSGPDEWEDWILAPGSVIFYEGEYHMWYAGGQFPDEGDFLIGHATSPDGISWTKDENNPVMDKGTEGAWDDHGIYLPSVLLMDTTFHMWYSGYSEDAPPMHSIGHATSTDGVTWVRDTTNPVLEKGASGAWDDTALNGPSVVFDGSEYHMYFHGARAVSDPQIGHATSPDGTFWTKDPQNPVLLTGGGLSWDWDEVTFPNVLFDNTTFHMWFSGGDFLAWDIGYATSDDGSTWTKYKYEDVYGPVLTKGESGSWDSELVSMSEVIIDSSMYKMWYRGQDPDGMGGTGYAVAAIDSVNTGIGIAHFKADQISIYPNPVGDLINVQSSEAGEYTIEISSVNGQMILSSKRSGSFHQVDLSSIHRGVYFITIRSEKFVTTKKFIKL